MKGFLALLFLVFLSVRFVCVEEMKRNYGVTSSSISMNYSDCWFHPVLVSNKYISLTCLPWLPTQAHGAWLSSSNRQLSRDSVRQPCWTSPWEPAVGKEHICWGCTLLPGTAVCYFKTVTRRANLQEKALVSFISQSPVGAAYVHPVLEISFKLLIKKYSKGGPSS